jgi:maleate isomerase
MNNYQVAQRARIGVIIPSTNTGVEYDLDKLRFDQVSWHPSRFWIELANWKDETDKTGETSNAVFERFLDLLREDMPFAVKNVLSCKPTHIMMGMSAETFWGGVEGNIVFEKAVRDLIGPEMGLSTGAGATHDALQRFNVRKISVITPYPPVGDDNVRKFFTELGYEVHAIKGLNCDSGTSIAEVPIAQVLDAVREVDAPDVDAIVQCGTNLSTVDLFPVLEHWLGKVLIPINIATAWHALRACGVEDRITGLGRLLEEF